jgi:RHS repeat-associated protein
MADQFPFRFSTKQFDAETGFYYYGYRFYSPELGRWLSRDPVEEQGGLNLYGFVGNDPVDRWDMLGLGEYSIGNSPPKNELQLNANTWNTMTGDALDIALILARTRMTIAGGRLRGMPDASAHLAHFLDNSGTRYTNRFKNMNKESASARQHYISEMNDALAAAERLLPNDGRSDIVTVREESAENMEGNWLYAVGIYRTWAKGTVKKCGDTYELVWSFNFRDNYDWELNNGLGGGIITDREMALLHRYGRAREYEMVGEQSNTIKWKKGQRFETGARVSGGGR